MYVYIYIYISVCVYVCTVACECFLCFSTSWVPILDDFSSHLNMQHLETRMNMTHAVYVCGGTLRLCMHVWVSACVCTANAKAGSANAMIIYLSVCLEWMSHVYNRIGVWWLCKQVCKQDVAQQDATIPGQFRTNCRVRVQNTTIWCSLQAWDHTNDEILLPESTKIHQSNQCEGKKTRFLDTAFHNCFLVPLVIFTVFITWSSLVRLGKSNPHLWRKNGGIRWDICWDHHPKNWNQQPFQSFSPWTLPSYRLLLISIPTWS